MQAINYHNFTIRVVDPGVEEPSCSSLPRYFLSQSNFSDTNLVHAADPYRATQTQLFEVSSYQKRIFEHIICMNCRHPVNDNSKYVNTTPCVKWHSEGYIYAIAGDLKATDFEVGCLIKLVSPMSWWGLDSNPYSYAMMNRALVYGFEMWWMPFACKDHCGNSMLGKH
ncbi:unnamed protein product [Sphenostylis stenocarpa]|uniref:Uncharacterized protein n=1 Tax=Sphenostylis stenocarpa TaxID=92480 RepID=A0AA86SZW6_9FABA|nr:unnamed protein product [Sphenostylis stenocarpa]